MTPIEPYRPARRAAIEALLLAEALPLDGLDDGLDLAVVGAGDVGPVEGFAAVEPHGRSGLLRSVVVAPRARGRGLGRRLVAAAERRAAERGLTDLYLLTETAAEWFPRLGYRALGRDAVPADVARSVEFGTACAVTAVVMHKRLGQRAARQRSPRGPSRAPSPPGRGGSGPLREL